MVNLGDQLTVAALRAPGAVTTTTNGSAVDLISYADEVAFVLQSAAGTGTTPTLDCKIQDSADGSTGWADIGVAFDQVTNAAAVIQRLSCNKNEVKRYVRLVMTVGGTTPSFTLSALVAGVNKYPA